MDFCPWFFHHFDQMIIEFLKSGLVKEINRKHDIAGISIVKKDMIKITKKNQEQKFDFEFFYFLNIL